MAINFYIWTRHTYVAWLSGSNTGHKKIEHGYIADAIKDRPTLQMQHRLASLILVLQTTENGGQIKTMHMIFSVICNDRNYLNQTIDWYNSSYKTDFNIIRIITDEVDFAEIEVTKYKPSDLFDLGYQFGVKEEKLRQKGKIDW